MNQILQLAVCRLNCESKSLHVYFFVFVCTWLRWKTKLARRRKQEGIRKSQSGKDKRVNFRKGHKCFELLCTSDIGFKKCTRSHNIMMPGHRIIIQGYEIICCDYEIISYGHKINHAWPRDVKLWLGYKTVNAWPQNIKLWLHNNMLRLRDKSCMVTR